MKKYKDGEWMNQQYWVNGLCPRQIGELCSAGQSTIRRWMIRLNIPLRSRGEAFHLRQGNHCNLSLKAKEWINGELLGDGCLIAYKNYSARFSYSSKHLEYIQYISKTLASFGIKQGGNLRKRYFVKNNYYCYNYQSLAYPELFLIWKNWYPGGKKAVPVNLILTPLTTRQWYIGDGTLACYPKRKKTRPRITLYTCGFLPCDVQQLIRQLKAIDLIVNYQLPSNSIAISAYSTKDFLNYIGNCPIACYQYKWDYCIGGKKCNQ